MATRKKSKRAEKIQVRKLRGGGGINTFNEEKYRGKFMFPGDINFPLYFSSLNLFPPLSTLPSFQLSAPGSKDVKNYSKESISHLTVSPHTN